MCRLSGVLHLAQLASDACWTRGPESNCRLRANRSPSVLTRSSAGARASHSASARFGARACARAGAGIYASLRT